MLVSLLSTPQGSRGQMELHVGVHFAGEGVSKRKQTAGFFSERPKKESENISHVAQNMPFLSTTHRISVNAAALLSQALGGGLTGEVTPSQRSFERKLRNISQTRQNTRLKLLRMRITRSSQSLWRIRLVFSTRCWRYFVFGVRGQYSLMPVSLGLYYTIVETIWNDHEGIVLHTIIYIDGLETTDLSGNESALYSGACCMWHISLPETCLCLVNCMIGPPHNWETTLSRHLTHSGGLMGCFPWRLGLWFIGWASGKACTGGMSVCVFIHGLLNGAQKAWAIAAVWDVTVDSSRCEKRCICHR